MGDFRKKKQQQQQKNENRVILRGKIFFKEIPEEKNPRLKKISFMAFNVEKKSYTFVCHGKKKFNFIARRLAGKKFLPKPKHPYSPPPPPPSFKSQMVDP